MNFVLRKATINDIKSLETLISLSVKSINKAYYSNEEIDAALNSAWVVDKQLILDKTYWIVEDVQGLAIGCGGWSKRNLLFGKNDDISPSENQLTAGVDSARIRAFFVHPDSVRQGIGSRLLNACETEAKAFGFDSLELVATLSGEKLYASKGYIAKESYEIELGNGITNKVVSMEKRL